MIYQKESTIIYSASTTIDFMSIGLRVTKARKHADLSKSALAIACKISKQAIGQIENESTKNPQPITLKKIAAVCGVSLDWLIDGEGDMLSYNVNEGTTPYSGTNLAVSTDDAVERQKTGLHSRRVPVFTTKEVLERKSTKDISSDDQTVSVLSEVHVSENAFGWQINTNELGDLGLPFATPVQATLIIEPELKPKTGNWLLLTDKNNLVMVKRLEIDGPYYYLHSLKSKHEPFPLDETYFINGVVASINLKTI